MLEKEKSNERKFKNQNILANIDDKKVFDEVYNSAKNSNSFLSLKMLNKAAAKNHNQEKEGLL